MCDLFLFIPHSSIRDSQLLTRDGDVVGVKTSSRFNHAYMGLLSFLKYARADEMSLVTLEGSSASLLRCPCFEWEGACKRCKGDMVCMGVHHPERKIRVNVVDLARGVDAWVPLYQFAAHQLVTLQSFCKSAGVVTATPMHVLKIELGGGVLPDGWRVDFAPHGYVYTNYVLHVSQDEHPTMVSVWVGGWVGGWVGMCLCLCLCLCVCVCVYVCVHACLCVCVCIRVYIYTCMYIYIYAYICMTYIYARM